MDLILREVGQGRTCRIYAMSTPEGCRLHSFLQDLHRDNPDAFARTAALLDRTAESGPPKNDETKCRYFSALRAFELKTRDGVRLMAFWDEDMLVICTHGFLKKGPRTPAAELERLRQSKADYFAAKRQKRIRFDELDGSVNDD